MAASATLNPRSSILSLIKLPGCAGFFIGMAVLNREGAALGQVLGLIETGPHCVLRVQPTDATAPECLIPFVGAYVDAVDLPGRLITVDWDPGD